MKGIAASDVSRYLEVDPYGDLRWRVDRRGNAKAGDLAGAIHRQGHRVVRLMGHLYAAKVLAWAIHYGEWPRENINFEDGNKRNLAKHNLTSSSNHIRLLGVWE